MTKHERGELANEIAEFHQAWFPYARISYSELRPEANITIRKGFALSTKVSDLAFDKYLEQVFRFGTFGVVDDFTPQQVFMYWSQWIRRYALIDAPKVETIPCAVGEVRYINIVFTGAELW